MLCNLKGNQWNKLQKMTKNLISGPILACLVQIWALKFIFQGFISTMPELLPLSLHCRKLSLITISYAKTYDPNAIKWQKILFWVCFRPIGFKFEQPFFSQIWLCQSLDFMICYHHVKCKKKLMMQFWKNLLRDGQTDRKTDWHTRMVS